MERVLITGGAGFVGANFARKFLSEGFDVHILERENFSDWRIKDISDKLKIHSQDITDSNETKNLIEEVRPSIILHFAAYGTVQRDQKEIKKAIDTNVSGTINLINAAMDLDSFKCFLNTGSSSEYGIKDKPMSESDALSPVNIYGISKAAASMYASACGKQYSFPIATMRIFSAYGYFEEKGKLIPTVVKSCLNGKDAMLGSRDSVRDFVFIEDIIDAYSLAVEKIANIKGEIINVGTGVQSSVSDVFNNVKNIAGAKNNPIYNAIPSAQIEPQSWVADVSKAKDLLGWEAKNNLEEGLSKTVSWFKNSISLYE